jgi:hypothetical protein
MWMHVNPATVMQGSLLECVLMRPDNVNVKQTMQVAIVINVLKDIVRTLLANHANVI